MGLTLVTPPTVWPVTLAEAKDQCRVVHSAENTFLEGVISDACGYVQDELSLSLAETTWRYTLDEFSDAIELPMGPVLTVTSLQYVDVDGVTQTVSTDSYTLDLTNRPPFPHWLVRNTDYTWPTTLDGILAVSATYTAGFTAETLPGRLRRAILLIIQRDYERSADPKIVEGFDRAIQDQLRVLRRIFV